MLGKHVRLEPLSLEHAEELRAQKPRVRRREATAAAEGPG